MPDAFAFLPYIHICARAVVQPHPPRHKSSRFSFPENHCTKHTSHSPAGHFCARKRVRRGILVESVSRAACASLRRTLGRPIVPRSLAPPAPARRIRSRATTGEQHAGPQHTLSPVGPARIHARGNTPARPLHSQECRVRPCRPAVRASRPKCPRATNSRARRSPRRPKATCPARSNRPAAAGDPVAPAHPRFIHSAHAINILDQDAARL
jgi:hypothetical protein